MIQVDEHIFQMGWFNHHLEKKGTWPEPNLHGFQVPADNLPGLFFFPNQDYESQLSTEK